MAITAATVVPPRPTRRRRAARRRTGGSGRAPAPGHGVAVAAESPSQPPQRIPVAVGEPLLHRDDGVVGDVDVLGADVAAALGDVAETETSPVARQLTAVEHVLGVHLQAGDADEEAWAEEAVALIVRADDMAGVLAEEALDALAVLVEAVDVHLLDAPRFAIVRGCGEGGDELVYLVVAGDVGDQILDQGEGLEEIGRAHV